MLHAFWNDDRLLRMISGFFLAMSLFVIVSAAGRWLINRPWFFLTQVELNGEIDRMNVNAFRSNVVPKLKGSFFAVDLKEVRKLVEKQPWVRRASVSRVFPNGLKITVQAHKPLAYWGETQLLNSFGEVFSVNLDEVSDEDSMATLNGPVGTEAMVAEMYVRLANQLREISMTPARVELSDRFAWAVKTSNGVDIELGREQENISVDDRVQRLIQVYPQIEGGLMSKIDRLDLRYPRAIAVRGTRTTATKEKVPSEAVM